VIRTRGGSSSSRRDLAAARRHRFGIDDLLSIQVHLPLLESNGWFGARFFWPIAKAPRVSSERRLPHQKGVRITRRT